MRPSSEFEYLKVLISTLVYSPIAGYKLEDRISGLLEHRDVSRLGCRNDVGMMRKTV